MPEATAQKKFSCPACGAAAEWNPAKQSLVCPFCGTTSPAQMELDAAGEQVIKEHDLVAAIRGIPDDKRGWQAKKTSVKCQSCQAISVFDAERVGQRCDFCGSAALVPYEEIKEAFRPGEFAAGQDQRNAGAGEHPPLVWQPVVRAEQTQARRAHRHGKGLYIPYWTFDAQVHADWTAESGYYYYETESYTDANGKRQTRQVRKIRWQWSSGALDHFFDDELVPASRGRATGFVAQGGAVSHKGSFALQRGLSFRLGGGALPD